ncbi:MAG: pyridoxal phosphate-dependent aminotransferase [SAR202 cluster bacterium]|nr:pyridoxal phosphate-dependent aminotransferase [SAR202 cluster bacterium]|tara:strand:- start:41279 stop:42445 length:1167 start_codon:yes stop_codon:yes gene_type:complete
MKLASRMDRLGTETAFEVLAKAKKLEAEGKEIIHLEIGEPDFDTPSNIVEAGRSALSNGYTHYGPSPGLMEVRETIAQEVRETRGIDVSGENVVITPGAKPIMFFVIMALIDAGDEVLYPNPGFPIYESMINFVGGVPVPMELSMDLNFDIDLDKVVESITPKTKMIIVNSPNNPCGSIVSQSALKKLSELASENNIIVLSDEIYRRFLYGGDFQSISSFNGMTDRTIILDGLSKTYAMTGWRIGYGVMPIGLVESISKLSTNSVSCTASFTQIAAAEAITGSQERALEIVEEFDRRRHIIVNGLNSINGINCPMPDGAFYVFPSIKDTGMDSRVFADKLLQDFGVASLAGESFGEFGKGHLRFSFANSVENIEKALEKINQFVQSSS